MKKIFLKCPKCVGTMSLDEIYANLIDNIDIICPICNEKSKGKEFAATKKECIENAQDGEIVGLSIISNYIDEDGTPGGNGDFYEIKNDRTVVGRKSSSSTADVQIESNRYMSRQHIVISKSRDSYMLGWATPTNPPLVNGAMVPTDKKVFLKDGDQITLGQCVMEWKCKGNDPNKSVLL